MITKNGKVHNKASRNVKIIDDDRQVIAMAQVVENAGRFTGSIDLRPMPLSLRQKFEEYEEIVEGQMFSVLDEIEEQIDAMLLRVAFDEGDEASTEDLQIYPSTKRISFKIVKETVQSLLEEATIV